MWDYNSGTAFQTLDDIPQPGSLEAEAGVFCSTFDMTGTRLITGCADKTIKVRELLPHRLTMIEIYHYRYMPSKTSCTISFFIQSSHFTFAYRCIPI